MRKFIATLREYLIENVHLNFWYRGYTTNTKNDEYVWITSNEQHANQYADINKYLYGGNIIIDKFEFDEDKFNLNDLYSYDMDDMVDENDIDDFLNDVNVDYEYINLFDIMEDNIPLSRLVNMILDELVQNYDGFKIMENDIKTIYLKNKLLKTIV